MFAQAGYLSLMFSPDLWGVSLACRWGFLRDAFTGWWEVWVGSLHRLIMWSCDVWGCFQFSWPVTLDRECPEQWYDMNGSSDFMSDSSMKIVKLSKKVWKKLRTTPLNSTNQGQTWQDPCIATWYLEKVVISVWGGRVGGGLDSDSLSLLSGQITNRHKCWPPKVLVQET